MKQLIQALNIILFLLLILMVFLLGFQTGSRYDIAVDENDKYVAISYSVNEQKMRRLMSLIDNHYVDAVDGDSLVDKTIAFVMSNLDPHSLYLDKKNTAKVSEDLSGRYVGIGIEYLMKDDTLVIARTQEISPNKNLFLLSDRILSVNGENVTGVNANKAEELIKGEVNSTVRIELLRDGKSETVEAIRRTLPRNSVTAFYMLQPGLGYIKLVRFSERSYQEFHAALLNLQQQGMKQLVFDLRGNPGGIMTVAEKIADEFLTDRNLIVFTIDKQGKKQSYYSTEKGDFEGRPVYVLLDETSASASEIVAGALQDNDIGTIVGRRSFGKGLVQREISLGDGTKVRLTTARYFTPTGRSIQKPYEDSDVYNKDLMDRYFSGEMFSKDSIKIADSLKFTTPKGKTVYGGGGIIPDVFVPIESNRTGRWFYEHINTSDFQRTVFDYIDKNHKTFQVLLPQHFVDYWQPDEFLKQYFAENQINTNRYTQDELDYFKTFIKGLMARLIYGEIWYEKIWNRHDRMIQKVESLYLENHGQ